MRRRTFVGLLAATGLVPSVRAFAQVAKVPRVGVLVSAPPPHPLEDALRRGLSSLGYTDGRTVALDVRYTDGRADRAGQLALELVGLDVDVIVAHFTPAVRAAMNATRAIPIVMAPAGAPLQLGFIDSLARPGGNVTGLSGMDAEIGSRRLQVLRELIPNLARVAVLASTPSTDPYSGPYVADLRSAATQLGLRLEPVFVSGLHEFESAFSAMARAGAQAVVVQGLFDPHRNLLVALAAKHRLAYMSHERHTAAAGALVALSADYMALYERVAYYVDRILRGARPAELPVEQPTKFSVIVNLRTARELGLKLSPALLTRVDEIIE